jgi:hypothetical protein
VLIFVYIKKIIVMEFLNLNQIGQSCPSALTQSPSSHLSHIYKFIPTTEVIDILGEQGWLPTQAVQLVHVRDTNLNHLTKNICYVSEMKTTMISQK